MNTDAPFPFNLPERDLKRYARELKNENRFQNKTMTRLSDAETTQACVRSGVSTVLEAWRSNRYLCQVYAPRNGMQRLSICRTLIDITNRRWRDGLTWDELMLVKREVGFGEFDAVEAYPADRDIVNVANFRHLWVFREMYPDFFWRKR